MNLTTAFLFLFITIVTPGFIFYRIYFYGEFSKQFSTRENIPRLLLLAVIPGLLISAIYLPLYNWLTFEEVKLDRILILFENLSQSKVNQDRTSMLYFGNYRSFIGYCIAQYLFSALLAFLLSRVIVRGLRLDRKWKTLRFRNQWYYVFSGEVFEIKKFENASIALAKKTRKGKDVLLAKADVLINGPRGDELYSGYVADYDLNPGDISKLDNIYLLDAVRYKTVELEKGEPNLRSPVYTEKKLIPGELFVLNMSTVININISYLLRTPGDARVKGSISRSFNLLVKLLSGVLLGSAVFLFYNPGWINFPAFERFHLHYPWYYKVLILILLTNIIDVINPTYDEKTKTYRYVFGSSALGIVILWMKSMVLLIKTYFQKRNRQ